jgi:hypothetical protein
VGQVSAVIPHTESFSAQAIGCPLIDSIKALRTNVARKDPQNRISKSESEKVGTSGRHKRNANNPAPLVGIHNECRNRRPGIRPILPWP